MEKKIVTLIADDEYDDLYKRVKKAKRYSEVLYPDKVPTEMWISDGKLLSRLKGDLHIKQILPTSQAPQLSKTWKPQSGYAKSVDYIMKRDNLPYNVVSDIMFQLYRMHDIPKSVELPKELLDTIQIGSLTKEEAAQLQALEESDVEKGEEKTDV